MTNVTVELNRSWLDVTCSIDRLNNQTVLNVQLTVLKDITLIWVNIHSSYIIFRIKQIVHYKRHIQRSSSYRHLICTNVLKCLIEASTFVNSLPPNDEDHMSQKSSIVLLNMDLLLRSVPLKRYVTND